MTYVVDIEQPWFGPGYSSYDVEGLAEHLGMSVEDCVNNLEEATREKGGRVVYKGDPEKRPQWLKDEMAEQARETR